MRGWASRWTDGWTDGAAVWDPGGASRTTPDARLYADVFCVMVVVVMCCATAMTLRVQAFASTGRAGCICAFVRTCISIDVRPVVNSRQHVCLCTCITRVYIFPSPDAAL